MPYLQSFFEGTIVLDTSIRPDSTIAWSLKDYVFDGKELTLAGYVSVRRRR